MEGKCNKITIGKKKEWIIKSTFPYLFHILKRILNTAFIKSEISKFLLISNLFNTWKKHLTKWTVQDNNFYQIIWSLMKLDKFSFLKFVKEKKKEICLLLFALKKTNISPVYLIFSSYKFRFWKVKLLFQKETPQFISPKFPNKHINTFFKVWKSPQ